MADTMEVEVTGKSKYEVAHEMAVQILTILEGKKWGQGGITKAEYLKTHYECIRVLGQNNPG
jgi:hypothetical protein